MAEGRAAPLALFPSPTCHLVCPASLEPLCRSPRPRWGPLAALKSRAGRRWCWAGHDVRGRGQREHGRTQSLRAQPGSCPLGFWHAWCFSSSQCGRGEILSSWGKEKPLRQSRRNVESPRRRSSSRLCPLDKFLSSCLLYKNPGERWVEARGRASLLMGLLLASEIRAVPEGKVGHFCAWRGRSSSVWARAHCCQDAGICALLKGLGHLFVLGPVLLGTAEWTRIRFPGAFPPCSLGLVGSPAAVHFLKLHLLNILLCPRF